MKYKFFYFLFGAFFFLGCTKKTDQVFDKTVDERLSETLTTLETKLTSEAGWKLYVYPKGLEKSQNIKIGGLTYYLKFSLNNRVTMVSDFAPTGAPSLAATPKESGYRLKALQRPSLIFDTYTYMHIAADPDPNVSFSPVGMGGYGYGTDFNFSFKDMTPKDTMYLDGNFNKSSAVLVKASQAEMDAAFKNGRLSDIINFTTAYQSANPFLYFTGGTGFNVGVGFDFSNFMISFSYLEGTNLVNKTMPSSFTTYGIHLGSAVTIGNYTFQDLFWDDVKKIYYITTGTARVELANSPNSVITLSLAGVIGNQFTTISVPPGAGLPNESPLFVTKYNAAKTGMLNGSYNLALDDMDFDFDAVTKTMFVNVYVFQGSQGFLAQYVYSYTVDGTGFFKFTKVSQNGNGGAIVTNMNNILSYIEGDQFKIEGIGTSVGFLGRFTSRQTPTFYFTGHLL